ncbi:MAG: beta-lactamase family protein, partial [Acidobacteriales bacterium]|nr:beta-lactamase family protein [Terriglobales bacterium]
RRLEVDVQAQDEVFRQAFDVLRQGIERGSFPAASLAINSAGRLVALKALGRFTYDASSPLASTDTLFDLASLTKVVATTPMAMLLYQRGVLDLEEPLAGVLPEFAGDDPRRRKITLHMLLAHSSGLPAYEKLYLRAADREALVREALRVPLKADPGTHSEYSDIGFILLGLALEKIAEEPIDQFCQREIFGPLGMAHTGFHPPPPWHTAIPPTADDHDFRRRKIQGEVQDENASIMAGVAGHAGLFSSAWNLAIFAQLMIHGGVPIYVPEALARFVRRENFPPGTSRALGWDTPSSPSQSGKYFSPTSYGHLGYTGTSLWIDPQRGLAVTLLTNRTWPDCSNQAIQQIRPRFHDSVIEALELEKP